MEIVDYILRALFSFIDRLIAWGIEKTYIVICDISTLMINSGVIKEFSNRINVFLGLFMLFWLAVRTISYVVEPDKFSDNSQGFSKVVRNTVVMLVMLVLVNYVFTFAYRIQNELLGITSGKNTMLKLVFGTNYVSSSSSNKEIAYKLPLYLYSSFLEPSSRIKDKCSSDKMLGKDAQVKKDCVTMLSDLDPDGNLASYYSMAYGSNGGVNSLLDLEVVTKKKSGKFIFTYRYLISTICGGMMLIMMVSTAIDIAIRIFKFAFLQLIAPIPIISYIDPKSGEDGMFKKWLQNCLSTYASIFIRLFSVYFAVYMIVLVATSDTSIKTISGETYEFTNPFVTVMLILGALQFAKQFPKLINEIFGIELGGGTFGSMVKATGKGLKKGGKAAGGVAIGAGAAVGAGAVAGLGGGIANAGRALRNNHELKKRYTQDGVFNKNAYKNDSNRIGFVKGGLSTLAGAGSAAGRGAVHSATSKDGILKSAGAGVQGSVAARNNRETYSNAGYNAGSRIADAFDDFSGYRNSDGGIGKFSSEISAYNQQIANYEENEHQWRKIQTDTVGNSKVFSAEEFASMGASYDAAMASYDEARNNGMSEEWVKSHKDSYIDDYISKNYSNDQSKADEARKYLNAQKEISNYDQKARAARGEVKKRQAVVDSRNKNK